VCGSWGNESHLGSRGTQPARRRKRQAVCIGQRRRIDIAGCLKILETGSSQHQARFMHRVSVIVHCVVHYCTNNPNRNRVLLYYLFQENKSFGSKKPFAFILWCTGSCVDHNTDIHVNRFFNISQICCGAHEYNIQLKSFDVGLFYA
jgi:hypothetical protein